MPLNQNHLNLVAYFKWWLFKAWTQILNLHVNLLESELQTCEDWLNWYLSYKCFMWLSNDDCWVNLFDLPPLHYLNIENEVHITKMYLSIQVKSKYVYFQAFRKKREKSLPHKGKVLISSQADKCFASLKRS